MIDRRDRRDENHGMNPTDRGLNTVDEEIRHDWTEEEIRAGSLPTNSDAVLEAVLYRGELPRGDVARVLGVTDRHARRISSALLVRGVLVSDGSRAPLRLAFPAKLASRWMPGLFPEQTL